MRFRVLSFKNAIEGVLIALHDEAHLKFHFLAGCAAIGAGLFFQITHEEWLAIFVLIGLVISLELTNTAIEETVNAFTDKMHPSAKKAKDVAAGAVLIASIASVLVGIIIFLPHLIRLLAQ